MSLKRLLQPQSIAVIGGGAWCTAVIAQSRAMGFAGTIWPVHPQAKDIGGLPAFTGLADLPSPPDASFIGINRHATIKTVEALSAMGAGGAVCFASGYAEARSEDASGDDLQARLIRAAGDMPILGPNCYGFINTLDGALLWPDQHGCTPVDRGVAILTQSSNIAINLTMQKRGLPIAYMVTCGNMAQTSQAQIAAELLDDPRVTAIGLHIEGFGDLRQWEALAAKAWARGVPLVALKVGASVQAQQATISHTASLAGSDAGATALLNRLGVPRLGGLPEFLETLKLLHVHGPLNGTGIASISCSGGEASLIADMALETDLHFPSLRKNQKESLRAALGPMVALSNPLDYHTYIWRDSELMGQAWSAMTGEGISMTLSVVDYPTTDPTDWSCATEAALIARRETGAPFAVVSSLPELMPAETAQKLIAGGVVPFQGLREALLAVQAAGSLRAPSGVPLCLAGDALSPQTLTEDKAKSALVAFGLSVPAGCVIRPGQDAAQELKSLKPPFAVKGLGLAHKSEQSAVRLQVSLQDVDRIAREIGTPKNLVEEMVPDAIAELLIGIVRDPAHGFVLTIGAGGVLTEVLKDTKSLLLPVAASDVRNALEHLSIAPILNGYRGKPAVDKDAITSAVLAIQAYVVENAHAISEVEVNPLLCTADAAVAVDALIRKS